MITSAFNNLLEWTFPPLWDMYQNFFWINKIINLWRHVFEFLSFSFFCFFFAASPQGLVVGLSGLSSQVPNIKHWEPILGVWEGFWGREGLSKLVVDYGKSWKRTIQFYFQPFYQIPFLCRLIDIVIISNFVILIFD